MREPVAINVAVAAVIQSGIALLAVLWPDRLTPELQAAIIAFSGTVITLVTIIVTRNQTTPVAAPVLPAGTEVATPQGTTAVVAPVPPAELPGQ